MNDKLSNLLLWWQKMLKLQDWNISVVLAEEEGELENEGSLGECNAESANRSAVITLLDPLIFKEKYRREGKRTFEICLVHELLHIVLWEFLSNERIKRNLLEAAVDAIAIALVTNKYRK